MFNEIGTQRADPESFFIITHFTPKTRESQKIAIKTMKNSFAHIFSTLIKILADSWLTDSWPTDSWLTDSWLTGSWLTDSWLTDSWLTS